MMIRVVSALLTVTFDWFLINYGCEGMHRVLYVCW